MGRLPWAVVDEEMDILRRSRSEITESLSSSSGCELEGGAEEAVEEEGVGKTGFVCDAMGRWFCKAPTQLAENLRLLRRRFETERDWGWQFETRVERVSVGAIIGGFLSSACSRGCWPRLWWRVKEPRGRLRWFPLGTVIGAGEGNTANNIREGS